MYTVQKWTYQDLSVEFAHLIPEWDELPDYAQDATIRDAVSRGNEFWRYWDNLYPNWTLRAFVKNYIEVVDSLLDTGNSAQMWTQWGTTLRLLEVND